MGPANWVVCSSEVADMVNSMYEVDEIEVGDWRLEDYSYVRDIRLRPRRSVENLSITFTADTWTEIET
jgi:regulation of enolase protein 1 (concanavalin A-like superfamily)